MKKQESDFGSRMDDFNWVVVSRAEEEKPKAQPKKPAPKK
jgi:hypothetical protein